MTEKQLAKMERALEQVKAGLTRYVELEILDAPQEKILEQYAKTWSGIWRINSTLLSLRREVDGSLTLAQELGLVDDTDDEEVDDE